MSLKYSDPFAVTLESWLTFFSFFFFWDVSIFSKNAYKKKNKSKSLREPKQSVCRAERQACVAVQIWRLQKMLLQWKLPRARVASIILTWKKSEQSGLFMKSVTCAHCLLKCGQYQIPNCSCAEVNKEKKSIINTEVTDVSVYGLIFLLIYIQTQTDYNLAPFACTDMSPQVLMRSNTPLSLYVLPRSQRSSMFVSTGWLLPPPSFKHHVLRKKGTSPVLSQR